MQVYLPNLIIATGQGAMIPVLVFAAKHVHASPAIAALVVFVNGFGTMAFDLPAGRIVARVGEQRSSWVAAALLGSGLVGCLYSRDVLELSLFIFVQAAGWSVWNLVRLTHLSRVAPVWARGRALSIFGGVTRAGNVVGPFIFLAVAGKEDQRHVAEAFLIYLITVVVGFVWLVLARDRDDHAALLAHSERIRPTRVVLDNTREFATAGVGTLGVSLLRGSRNAIIGVWGSHIGLDAGQVSVIFAFSSLLDLTLFYPSGVVSDRWGRRAVAVPCIGLLSVGHLLIPFSHTYAALFVVALVLGFGNGMGSGIVMTLGADRAPSIGRASFLAVWRMVSDGGTAAGPLVDSIVVGLGAIAFAGPVVGVIGLGCGFVVLRYLHEPERQAEIIRDAPAGSSG
jgi:MFS family permease